MSMAKPRIEIPQGFPSGLTDDELAKFVDDWVRDYQHLYGDPSYHGADLKIGFIRLALEEQTRREVEGTARSGAQAARRALFVAAVTLGVAAVTLLVAITTLIIALVK